MTSRTQIINFALTKLGVQTVTSEDEASEPAIKAKLVFDTAVRSELRRHAWSFALARAQLAASSTPPAFGWINAFPLPTDCLRVIQVGEYFDFAGVRQQVDTIVVPYAIEARQILTDLGAPLKLRYVRDMSNEIAQWDAAFTDAMSNRLAIELAETLTKSTTRYEQATQMYKASITEARRCNAIELPPVPLPDNSFMMSRIY